MTTYTLYRTATGDISPALVQCSDGGFAGTDPALTDEDSKTYQAWLAAGNTPGEPGMSVADLLAYASEKQNALLGEVWTFDVGQNGASKKVTTRLDDKGQAAMLQISVWAATSGQNPAAIMPYSNVDFSSTTLTPAEASALTLVQAAAVKMKSYAVLNDLAAGIMATPPTITTAAQIDAAAWPSAVAP